VGDGADLGRRAGMHMTNGKDARVNDPLQKAAAASRDVEDHIFQYTVKPCITPETIAEHGRNPFGPGHSPDLEVVLRYLRRDPLKSKPRYVLIATEADERYCIAVHHRVRGTPPVVTDECFASVEEAQHAVFLKRLGDLEDDDVVIAIKATET
jgi:hypothetical protein